MNVRVETSATNFDKIKLVMSVTLVVIGIWSFYFFAAYSLLLRVIGLLLLSSGAVVLFLLTDPGRKLWRFAADSRMEVRKVIWPTRQETVQTTLIVVAMVFILGIILWLFDSLLMMILRFLTGHGG
jgi:preprotein translocase subunit SecE